MASLVSKLVLKKIFAESKENKQGYEDPYFETVPTSRMGFKTTKKLPKALPPGLSEKEEKTLVKAKRRAYRLDLALGSFLGIKIGWGAVIGLIPGIGDAIDLLLALMVYKTICSVDPPLESGLKFKMKFNIILDFLVGLVPFVGDLADAAYKANTKNVILFEDELRQRGKKRLKGTPQENMHDPSLADEFDYRTDETVTSRNGGSPPRYTSRRGDRRGDRRDRRDRRDDNYTEDLESQTASTVTEIAPPRRARTRDERDRRR